MLPCSDQCRAIAKPREVNGRHHMVPAMRLYPTVDCGVSQAVEAKAKRRFLGFRIYLQLDKLRRGLL